MEVAKTIFAQLGGQKFGFMTGAKNFVGSNDTLSFTLPGKPGYVKNGYNRVQIKLEADDTYTVTFIKFWKFDVAKEKKVSGVYCDNLQDVFTENTGLYTSM